MQYRITARREDEVPMHDRKAGRNEDLAEVKKAMKKASTGMVLEIRPEGGTTARGVKMMISRAAKELGMKWHHWSVGDVVYAQRERAQRGGRRKAA